MNELTESCKLCESTSLREESCGMYRCNDCHFFFLRDAIRKEQQVTFQKRKDSTFDEAGLERLKKKYDKEAHGKLGIYKYWAQKFVGWYGTDIVMLDVGASGGFLLYEVAQFGAKPENLNTLEINPQYVQLTKDYYGYDGAIGNIEEYVAERKYNLITMFDVLEHVDDFWSALSNMHTMLTPEGRIVLKLPNGRWAYLKYRVAKLLRLHSKIPVYLHIRPGGHLNYWDMNTIERICRDQFELEDFVYVRPTKKQFKNRYLLRRAAHALNDLLRTHLFPEMIVTLKKK